MAVGAFEVEHRAIRVIRGADLRGDGPAELDWAYGDWPAVPPNILCPDCGGRMGPQHQADGGVCAFWCGCGYRFQVTDARGGRPLPLWPRASHKQRKVYLRGPKGREFVRRLAVMRQFAAHAMRPGDSRRCTCPADRYRGYVSWQEATELEALGITARMLCELAGRGNEKAVRNSLDGSCACPKWLRRVVADEVARRRVAADVVRPLHQVLDHVEEELYYRPPRTERTTFKARVTEGE